MQSNSRTNSCSDKIPQDKTSLRETITKQKLHVDKKASRQNLTWTKPHKTKYHLDQKATHSFPNPGENSTLKYYFRSSQNYNSLDKINK